jgi:predicted secreted acid phosphatase
MKRTGAILAGMVAASLISAPAAAECPALPQTQEPVASPGPVNIDRVKGLLKDYHAKGYDTDMQAVVTVAQRYVLSRAGAAKRPAMVLDIDETSLSSWPEITANDFGFIQSGGCDGPAGQACGFHEWIREAKAPVLSPTLELFNAVKKKVAVFFVTGRRVADQGVTEENLNKAGYKAWAGIYLRPNCDLGMKTAEKPCANERVVTAYKTAMRAEIEKRYTIVANIGDQESDLDRDNPKRHSECVFKLPNPFYFIP